MKDLWNDVKKDPLSWLLAIAALSAVIFGLFGPLFIGKAHSHEWYPMECCHAMDCAPVTSSSFAQPIEATGLPQFIVTTKHGTVIVPKGHPFRESKDGRMHACMRPSEGGTMRLICIFAPPSM